MKNEIRNRIFNAIDDYRKIIDWTDTDYATKLGISPALYSRIKKGETDIVSDQLLTRIADILHVDLSACQWKIAETETYKYIWNQLTACKKNGISAMFCDISDIGKTVTAKDFARKNPNVVYIDCGLYKTRQQLIRKIAQDFGAYSKGRYHDILIGLIAFIKGLNEPMIILDEAGDVHYETFLELKALWNGAEHYCSWYMIGANGLKNKIKRGIARDKVGYEEMFRRYGKRFQRVTPKGEQDREKWLQNDAAMIIKINGGDVNKVLAKVQKKSESAEMIEGMPRVSPTRIRIELTKRKN